MSNRYFTVRLAINRADYAATTVYTNVAASDADEAAAFAATEAENETGRSGWVLDGPVEELERPVRLPAPLVC